MMRFWKLSDLIRVILPIAALGLSLTVRGADGLQRTRPVSADFHAEVMAVLSKAGCNAGPCHGNATGKGGMKLSLRGEDPDRDYEAIAVDYASRRVNPLEPDKSLLLLKATAQLAHEGGKRFGEESIEYKILRSWIQSGAINEGSARSELAELHVEPNERLFYAPESVAQLNVKATFKDGITRDVTRLAVYEPSTTYLKIQADGRVTSLTPGETTVLVRYLGKQKPVRLTFVPDRPDFRWKVLPQKNYVDRHIDSKLQAMRIMPAGEVGDVAFLRRAYLDLLGIPPTAEEAQQFFQNRRKDKRKKLIDELLKRPEFPEFWALKWADLLRNEEKALDRKGVELFHRWIKDSIAKGKPLDQFAREIIGARGNTYLNPPANFYRSHRTPSVRAEAVAQVFLGTRLLCAQCHNHPYDRWTQNDYHDWASLFGRVQYRVLDNHYPDGLDKHGFAGEQVVYMTSVGETKNPGTGQNASPRFLGEKLVLKSDEDRLDRLSAWVGSKENPLFAQVQVNRIWYHLMGRGLVDPVDDFRATNPASHPELLKELAKDFVEHGFDLRHVIRTVMNSRAYARGGAKSFDETVDEANYSHENVRRLGAESLLDAMFLALDAKIQFTGFPEGTWARQIPGVPSAMSARRSKTAEGEVFLRIFGKPERLLASEEERSCQTTLGQSFQLITGPAITELLRHKGNRLDQILASNRTTKEMVVELYWWTISRAPSEEESKRMTQHIDSSFNRRLGLEDLAWALLNSKEFVMRN